MTRRAGLDRTQVIAAAAALADANGLERLTLADVAAQVGVRLPSLYNHVAGLPDVQHELALLGVRQLCERVTRAAVGKSGAAALHAAADVYRGYVLEHPGVYAATVRAPAPDDAALLAWSAALIDVLLAVLEPFELGADGAIHAVRGFRSVVHGFATLETASGFGLALDRDESFRRVVHAFIAGLERA